MKQKAHAICLRLPLSRSLTLSWLSSRTATKIGVTLVPRAFNRCVLPRRFATGAPLTGAPFAARHQRRRPRSANPLGPLMQDLTNTLPRQRKEKFARDFYSKAPTD